MHSLPNQWFAYLKAVNCAGSDQTAQFTCALIFDAAHMLSNGI